MGITMSTRQVILGLWLGLLALLWSLHPLLLSQARGIVVLALLAGVLAVLGGLTSVRLFVVWSGGIGLLNLTMALLLTASPPNLWLGLSAGLTLLALLDGNQCVAYLRHCQVGPGVLAQLFGTLVAGYMTMLGAAAFVGFFPAFLLATSRWATLRTQDEWGEKGG